MAVAAYAARSRTAAGCRGRHDDHRAREPSGAEVVLEELAHLAAALADERDDATSAAVPRAIMPSSVLLPTPLPPNRPTRWPRPQVSSASMARTPVPSGDVDRLAASGLSGGGCSG
jgi:hypothetical protein